MSLYDDISLALTTKGLTNALGGGVDSALKNVGEDIAEDLGGGTFGKAVANIGTSMARNAAVGLANKYIPANMQRLANIGSGAIGDIMNGDFNNAGLRLLDSGLLSEFLPGMEGVGAQARFFNTPTPLFGGISPADARGIYQEMRGNRYCRKNLWLLEVSSKLGDDVSGRFNMFAIDLEYTPFTISGDKRKIGAAHVDCVNSSDPVELRMTVMDDVGGFIKDWFKQHLYATASSDGTVGVPNDYAIRIKVVHGFITHDSNRGGYHDIGQYRVANMDVSLSRREDGLQELPLTFVQLDTFMKV